MSGVTYEAKRAFRSYNPIMDWIQGLFNLLSACIGGGIAILVQRNNSRDEARLRSRDELAKMYTDFMVAFHNALMKNESYYEGVWLREHQRWEYSESKEEYKERDEAEQRFRETVWRLRVRERDANQKEMLEELARVFDRCYEDYDGGIQIKIADDYSKTAESYRAKATAIIDRAQELHGNQL